MKLEKNKFFKNFNSDYITFLNIFYKNKTIKDIVYTIMGEVQTFKINNNFNKKLMDVDIDYWLLKGWSLEEANLKIIEINKKHKEYNYFNKLYWINNGYTENDAIEKIKQIQSENSKKFHKKYKETPEKYKKTISPFTEEFWINKGITDKNEIKIKINSQRNINIEYWLNKGFNKDEAIKKISEIQKSNSIKSAEKNKKELNTFEYRKKRNVYIEYFLNKGYSLEESQELLKERQTTFTLEKCIIKHGLEKGTEIYNKRQKDWIRKVFNNNTCISTGRSMICDRFIEDLILSINNKEITDNFLYGENEKFIYDNIKKQANRYDLCYKNKIIEFNGDFWHGNPKIFKPEDIHKVKKIKCSEIWENDERKNESAKEHGYEIYVIWDSEYVNNKEKIIENCKKFLEI